MISQHFLNRSQSRPSESPLLNVLVDSSETQQTAERSLKRVIDDARVRAEPNVILRIDGAKSIAEHMVEISGKSDLVILGLREPLEDEKEHFVSHVTSFIDRLGTVLLVRASSQFEGASLLFDEE
jgi:hypothetical protein